MSATDPVIETIGPVSLSAQNHTTQAYRHEVSQKFGEYLTTADRFTGAFSVSDDGDVRDWFVAGEPGAESSHYQSIFTVDPAATRSDAITCVRRLAAGFAA